MFTKELLETLYWKEGKSLAQIGEVYHRDATDIKRWMVKFGIPRRPVAKPHMGKFFKCQICTKEFYVPKAQAERYPPKYCSIPCRTIGMRGRWLKKNDALTNTTPITHRLRKTIGKCQICGFNSELRILTTHHKNMNHSDNSSDNLLLLCPNCHSLEHLKAGNSNPRPPLPFFGQSQKNWQFKQKNCAFCGKEFKPRSVGRTRSKFCYDCLPLSLPLSDNANYYKARWILESTLKKREDPKRILPKKWCTIRGCTQPIRTICTHGHFCVRHWKNHWTIQGAESHDGAEVVFLKEVLESK